MEAVLRVVKSKWFVVLVVLLLVCLVILFGGPFLAIADYHPLDSWTERLITCAMLFVVWILWLQWKFFKALRASGKLAKEVSEPGPGGSAPGAKADAGSPEEKELRARFAEATATLGKGAKRGATLYDLPWFVIVGPPGSGKTTLLANSGLNFPLAKSHGRQAVRGVGGTRNCDWWFTDEAIFLDTAGRYTTQDSDRGADAAGWASFLSLLKRNRPRRPLNGVIVAISISDLMTQDDDAFTGNVRAVRARLEELRSQLKLDLPVYLLFTKMDLVAGFEEYFDDLDGTARQQVWGCTFTLEDSKGAQGAARFPGEFDALLQRIRTRMPQRLDQERDPRRRAAIFAFPEQLASVGPLVERFVEQAFSSTRYEDRTLLRGVYLSSGTQEGTPIDRMMAAVANSFGLESQEASPFTGKGKVYFIERLFRRVVLPESGLAGVDRRFGTRLALISSAAYVGIGVVALALLVAHLVSYARNRAYLDGVAKALEAYPKDPPKVGDGRPAAVMLSSLPHWAAMQDVVDEAKHHDQKPPWSMRWGLYTGTSMQGATQDAYLRELNGTLLPAFGQQFRERLSSDAAVPERQYEYLRAYLMLGMPEHLDPEQLAQVATLELRRMYPDAPEVQELIAGNVARLLADRERLRPITLDTALVDRAREGLRFASMPALAYTRIKLKHEGDTKGAIRVDSATGLGSERVLTRRSGKPLSDPIPALYTRPVFEQITGATGSAALLKSFSEDTWVLGDSSVDVAMAARMSRETLLLYEQDYARFWRELISDVAIVKPKNLDELRQQLGFLSGPTSPLRGLLKLLDEHTNLLKKKVGEAAAGSVVGEVMNDADDGKLGRALASALDAAGEKLPDRPGTLVTVEFEPYHRLVDSSTGSTPLDSTLAAVGQANQKLQGMGGGLGQASVLDVLGSGGGMGVDIARAAGELPEPFSTMLSQIGKEGQTVAAGNARTELHTRVMEGVSSECSPIVKGRFPFDVSASLEVPLEDFGRLFGYNGLYDQFFQQQLGKLVDTTRNPWQPREGAAALGVTPGLLASFRNAERIRKMFFKPGAQTPEARFSLQPESLDPNALGLVLELSASRYEYRHGPIEVWPGTWPSAMPQQVAISFQDNSGTTPRLGFQGPWAIFRLVAAAKRERRGDNLALSFDVGGHNAKLLLIPGSLSNPFTDFDVLRSFRCGG